MVGSDLNPPSLDRLIRELSQLPGVGRKSARRLAYHLLGQDESKVQDLSEAMVEAKRLIKPCSRCYHFTEFELCPICTSSRRDASRLCVVEKSSDIETFEASGAYKGYYHVLGGTLSPLDGIGPDQLHIPELVQRVNQGVDEVILALGSSPEAESTVLFIDRMLNNSTAKRTRLARGIPMGSDLDYVDQITMMRAFEGRVNL